MWQVVRALKAAGVTVILTTHYIEEAEEMADRIGVINKGEIIVVEEKAELMRKLGKKRLTLQLQSRLGEVPEMLRPFGLSLSANGMELTYSYDAQGERTGIATLLRALADCGIRFKDLRTEETSLEEIFVSLLKEAP
jgi:ABC-2 type transport system ATP-binding protein